MERQALDLHTDIEMFLKDYYLLEELTSFCRQYGLPTSGGKMEVTQRIAHFLKTREVLKANSKARKRSDSISLDTIIIDNLSFSEDLRAFFKQEIDASFKFNVPFQRWIKANVGKTYADAIVAYKELSNSKQKTSIDKQFEYNTYIRDFFSDNSSRSLKEAIICWKYKKQVLGNHKYEKSDLIALKQK